MTSFDHSDGLDERVVLVDATGQPTGTASKATVHHSDTPLHLAFSSYLTNDAGQVLLTRRALTKRTWPGVWTNSVCGHPGPGESAPEAVVRRVEQEIGVAVAGVEVVLPDFQYRAVDVSGVVENEVCPVFTAVVPGGARPCPNPDEVMDYAWADWADVVHTALNLSQVLSPWCVAQIGLMVDRGWQPPRV